jgi:hypothetical protein
VAQGSRTPIPHATSECSTVELGPLWWERQESHLLRAGLRSAALLLSYVPMVGEVRDCTLHALGIIRLAVPKIPLARARLFASLFRHSPSAPFSRRRENGIGGGRCDWGSAMAHYPDSELGMVSHAPGCFLTLLIHTLASPTLRVAPPYLVLPLRATNFR